MLTECLVPANTSSRLKDAGLLMPFVTSELPLSIGSSQVLAVQRSSQSDIPSVVKLLATSNPLS